MFSLPFYISNLMSCFVRKKDSRHRLRGRVNTFLYKPFIARFIRETFNEKVKTIQYVRQHTMGRCVCVVNDEYFVKIFRNMSKNRLLNFEFLVNYICKFINVDIPRVYAAKNNHMYATKKTAGVSIYYFDKELVLKNEQKILTQVDNIIHQLQSIDLKKIPNAERFCTALESTSKDIKNESITPDSVLSHGDLNVRNFLFDEHLNICGLIDFDSMRITNDREYDKKIFIKYWERYKKSTRKHPL